MPEQKESQQLKDLKKFSENLKRTRLGTEFTKRLFTEPSSISPAQITNIMKALGYNVPREVQMTADVAQVITSGQAIKSGIDAYQVASDAKDIQSATNATAGAIQTISMIAEKNGAIGSDEASLVRVGTSIGMLVASGGTDVKAWVSLALELNMVNAKNQGLAEYRAITDAIQNYKTRINPQINALAEIQLGLASGDLSSFGVIAKLAVEAPDLWPQVINKDTQLGQIFPDLLALPVVNSQVSGSGYSRIWGNYPWGGEYTIRSWSASRSIDVVTLEKNFTKEIAADFLYNLYIVPWVNVYSFVNNEIVNNGNMSIQNIAALSFLTYGANAEISEKENYVNLLMGTHLTPYDLGDNILDSIASQYVETVYAKADKTFHEQALSFTVNPLNRGFVGFSKDNDIARRKLLEVKQSDDIVNLVQYPFIFQRLQSYMDFQTTSFEKTNSEQSRKFVQVFNQGQATSDLRSWRKLNNYITVLKLLDTFRNDSYLKTTKYAQNLLPFMPSVDTFDKKVTFLNELSMGRNINALAKANIAGFIGTTSNNLVKVNTGQVGAAIFNKKG
jgi:hypothetical protein